MSNLLIFLVTCWAILHGSIHANPIENQPIKPLFVPSASYPALVHLQPPGYNTELLENAASFPRYAYGHDALEYADSLQKQVLFQNTAKRLEIFFRNRENEKRPESPTSREENYDKLANSILIQEEQKPEYEDLDRRYKRDVIYAVKSPVQQSIRVFSNKADEKPYPFGPYRPTTWIPYESRRETSQLPSRTRQPATANQYKQSQRRARKLPINVGDETNFEPNTVRTARPLEMPADSSKDFPDFNFLVPIQTKPFVMSSAKSDTIYPASSAYTEHLMALMRTQFSNQRENGN